MASPGERKGQRRWLCGHIMAAFDRHDKCVHCCEKKGKDPSITGDLCKICDSLTDLQKKLLQPLN